MPRCRTRRFRPRSCGPEKILWHALKHRQIGTIRSIFMRGANINQVFREHNGLTPLAVAVKGKNIALVKLLLELQCNIDQEVGYWTGETALFLAIRSAQQNIAELLIEAGANINHESTTTKSRPIFEAIGWSQTRIVEILLAHKVELKCKNLHNESPIRYALENYLMRDYVLTFISSLPKVAIPLHHIVRLLLPEVDLSECDSYFQQLRSSQSPLLFHIMQHMTVSGRYTSSTLEVGEKIRSYLPANGPFFLGDIRAIRFTEEFLWFFHQSCSYGNFFSYYDCHVKKYNTLALHQNPQWMLQSKEWESYMVLKKQLFSNPLSLQTFCCQVIRKQLSNYRMWYRIDKLPLPTLLKNKLKLIR